MLGVMWEVSNDEFIIDLRYIAKEANTHNPTKRHIISIASKIYDPMGIVSPLTIQFKILLQRLHCERVEWDEEINGKLKEGWIELISCINDSVPVTIPRCYFMIKHSEYQWRLVGFSDSSSKAYAAVTYLQCDDGRTK